MSVTRNEMIRWLAEWYRSIDSYPSREESEAFEAIRELIESSSGEPRIISFKEREKIINESYEVVNAGAHGLMGNSQFHLERLNKCLLDVGLKTKEK